MRRWNECYKQLPGSGISSFALTYTTLDSYITYTKSSILRTTWFGCGKSERKNTNATNYSVETGWRNDDAEYIATIVWDRIVERWEAENDDAKKNGRNERRWRCRLDCTGGRRVTAPRRRWRLPFRQRGRGGRWRARRMPSDVRRKLAASYVQRLQHAISGTWSYARASHWVGRGGIIIQIESDGHGGGKTRSDAAAVNSLASMSYASTSYLVSAWAAHVRRRRSASYPITFRRFRPTASRH